MRSAVPKHFHTLLGRRLVDWVILAAQAAGAGRVVVVCSPEGEEAFAGLETAVQHTPRGTGDAVASARASLEGYDGDVLVLNGDVPGLTAELLAALVDDSPSSESSRHRPLVRAAGPSKLRSGRPRRRRLRGEDRRGRGRDHATSWRSPRSTRASTCSRARSCGRRSIGSRLTTLRASCTSPTRSAFSSATASASQRTSLRIRSR